MEKTNIRFLMEYCYGKDELYNEIANELWVQFGIKGAEICLLCTYIADRMTKRTITEFMNDAEFPEDLEMDLSDYLERG